MLGVMGAMVVSQEHEELFSSGFTLAEGRGPTEVPLSRVNDLALC